MMNTSVVQGLEQQMETAKELKARRDMAVKLASNREFRILILEGFCLKDAARLVGESADPSLTPLQRSDALAMAQAAGHLKRFIQMAFQMGAAADRDITDLEHQLAEARAEEDQTEQEG